MSALPSVFDRLASLAGGYRTPSLVENGLAYTLIVERNHAVLEKNLSALIALD